VISAGEVPVGGWAVEEDEAVGAEVEMVVVAAWVVVEDEAVMVAISGNDRGPIAIGEVSGVRRIARRRESSSGSWTLPESDSEGSGEG